MTLRIQHHDPLEISADEAETPPSADSKTVDKTKRVSLLTADFKNDYDMNTTHLENSTTPLADEESSLALFRSTLEIRQRESDIENLVVHQLDKRIGIPWSQDIMATMTDLYQITMTYAYWKVNKHNQHAYFEVFFRNCPFGGEYAVMAGVNDVLRFLNTFKFTEDQIAFLKSIIPTCEEEFWDYLKTVDCSKIKVNAISEGTLIFPRIPVLTVEGPLSVCQLLETCVLNLLNFASLVSTNAARYRQAAGPGKSLLEFGLRRAQGPDGGMSASRFVYMGGFDATSNVRASFLFGLPCSGTHAHSFVSSFSSVDQIPNPSLPGNPSWDGPLPSESFLSLCVSNQALVQKILRTHSSFSVDCNEGELAAFIVYAQAFPSAFTALVDTYSVVGSGVPNFLAVALSLKAYGYNPKGLRIDSGDLAFLSRAARRQINSVEFGSGVDLSSVKIIASNSISEEVLHSLSTQDHRIDAYGIGTNLVTCSAQPALGMVYKLCDLDGSPRMKLSQDISKATLPFKKKLFRLYDSNNIPMLDFIQLASLPAPVPGQKVFCRHLSDDSKRCFVIPSRVESLLRTIWKNGKATRFAFAPHPFSTLAKIGDDAISPMSDFGELDSISVRNDQTALAGPASPAVATKEPSSMNPMSLATEGKGVCVGLLRRASTETSDALEEQTNSQFSPLHNSGKNPEVPQKFDGRNYLIYLTWCRERCLDQLKVFRDDHLRPMNPTPYKISASKEFVESYKMLWEETAPVVTYR